MTNVTDWIERLWLVRDDLFLADRFENWLLEAWDLRNRIGTWSGYSFLAASITNVDALFFAAAKVEGRNLNGRNG